MSNFYKYIPDGLTSVKAFFADNMPYFRFEDEDGVIYTVEAASDKPAGSHSVDSTDETAKSDLEIHAETASQDTELEAKASQKTTRESTNSDDSVSSESQGDSLAQIKITWKARDGDSNLVPNEVILNISTESLEKAKKGVDLDLVILDIANHNPESPFFQKFRSQVTLFDGGQNEVVVCNASASSVAQESRPLIEEEGEKQQQKPTFAVASDTTYLTAKNVVGTVGLAATAGSISILLGADFMIPVAVFLGLSVPVLGQVLLGIAIGATALYAIDRFYCDGAMWSMFAEKCNQAYDSAAQAFSKLKMD